MIKSIFTPVLQFEILQKILLPVDVSMSNTVFISLSQREAETYALAFELSANTQALSVDLVS